MDTVKSIKSLTHKAGLKNIRSNISPTSPLDEHIGKLCSICGTGISGSDTVYICHVCSLPYHYDCWKEIGGCGAYGCTAAPAFKKTEIVAPDTFSPGWTAEKKCPECGTSIIANALLCKICKASFPTERPMTKTEWKNREYDDSEILRVKTCVIFQFLLSVVGFLFVFTIPLNLLAIFTDQWLFRTNRLPQSLRILFYAGSIISVLWAVIALSLFAYSWIAS